MKGANCMRGLLAVALALGSLALAHPAAAQSQAASDELHVVTYVDVYPQFAADTARALKQFASDSAKDPGYLRIEVLRDIERSNHFTILEAWKTRKDYEAHLAQPHTKSFREKLQPWLGSPFDERLYHPLREQ